jgi:hypothetical protein
MQKSLLLLGLISENEESLKQQVQLWDASGVWAALGRKATGKMNPELLERINLNGDQQPVWNNIKSPQVADFQLMKLSRLSEAVNLKFPQKPSAVRLRDHALEIEARAIGLLREGDKEFSGNSITDLTRHVIQKSFSEFAEKFSEANSAEQDEIAGKILEEIDNLDEENKKRLFEELKVDELSNDQLIKLITSGGLATGLAAAVGASGFAAYTAVTSGIFAVSSLIGVTFPFAIYMYATAGLAFLTNPITIVLGGIGLGAWLTSKSNKAIYRRLAPMLVGFSCLNQSSPDPTDTLMTNLIDHISAAQDAIAFDDDGDGKILKKCFPSVAP